MKNIKHIVYIMLENRSFDHVLGRLYENDKPNLFLPPNTTPKIYNGLNTGDYYNADSNGNKYYSTPITNFPNNSVPTVDPHEVYEHVNVQLFGQSANPLPNAKATMSGFVKDYQSANPSNPGEIMQSYLLNSLPVLNFLAGVYGVSDAYYSSVPTQTNCNRAFAGSGNSIGNLRGIITGMVDNHWGSNWDHPWDPVEFTGRTMWNVLNDNEYTTPNDWTIFYSQLWLGHDLPGDYCYTQDLFWPSLQNHTDHFSPIQKFFDLAAAGKLPKFSFLEPAWFQEIDGEGFNGTDYHPPGNLLPGEQFLVKLFGAIKNSPCWNDTLFIINFDEHGGTYDHQAPPWGATPPWANAADGTARPQATECEFQFNRFGVRVPLILVSPYIQSGTVFRSSTAVPFDHTSVIATILNHFTIPKSKWQLGSRVANAPTFENVLTLNTPRTDNEEIIPRKITAQQGENAPANDLQLMIIHRMIARALQKANYPKDKFQGLYDTHFKDIKTLEQLITAAKEVTAMIRKN